MGTTKWTEEILHEARKRTDPFADQFVAQLAKDKTPAEIFVIMQFLLDEFVWLDHESLDEPQLKYLESASLHPSWADEELIKKGGRFFLLT